MKKKSTKACYFYVLRNCLAVRLMLCPLTKWVGGGGDVYTNIWVTLKATYISLYCKTRQRIMMIGILESYFTWSVVRRFVPRQSYWGLFKTSVILCFFFPITLNSGCECLSKAISYTSLVNFDMIWKFFLRWVPFSIKYKKQSINCLLSLIPRHRGIQCNTAEIE